MLVECVADLGKPLIHVWNFVNACCFSVRSTDMAGSFSRFPFVAVLVAIHKFFFGCFVFGFLFRFMFWLLSVCGWMRVVHKESVTSMFAEKCCAWRNL